MRIAAVRRLSRPGIGRQPGADAVNISANPAINSPAPKLMNGGARKLAQLAVGAEKTRAEAA
jgi:hypothetical protein